MHRLVLILQATLVLSHNRLACPPSRSLETGAKVGPCDAADDPSQAPFPLHPGLNTITWIESLSHPGAPARLALSIEGSDNGFEECILVDHIPHDERADADGSAQTYQTTALTVWIPDVYCERCTLQLITVMSDEYHGVPEGESCAYSYAQAAGTAPGHTPACQSVYHSCAPVSIDGAMPRSEYTCSTSDFEAELQWPFGPAADYRGSTYDYRGDPGMYDDDFYLVSGGLLINGGCDPTMAYGHCDPAVWYTPTTVVPPSAPYRTHSGECLAPLGTYVCADEPPCAYKADGDCDDGGEGAEYFVCEYGTDCTDCGARPFEPPSPPAPPPAPSRPPRIDVLTALSS